MDPLLQGVMAVEGTDLAAATRIKDELVCIGEKLAVLGGETLGVAELLGLRYGVKAYEAQVSPELYRGSRVDAKGMAALQAQGIRGVVSFCLERSEERRVGKECRS